MRGGRGGVGFWVVGGGVLGKYSIFHFCHFTSVHFTTVLGAGASKVQCTAKPVEYDCIHKTKALIFHHTIPVGGLSHSCPRHSLSSSYYY
jgi:hypothetical protein